MSNAKELPLYHYNLVAGMEPAEAAHSARKSVVVGYAMSLSLAAFAVTFGAFMYVLFGPGFEGASASERLVVVGCLLTVGLIGLVIFPIKAKDVYVWICYGIMIALAVTITVLGYLL